MSQDSLGSSIRSSRIVLQSRDECRDRNRLECAFEFKCEFESRFEYGIVHGFECVLRRRENNVPGNQSSVDKRDCPTKVLF